MTQLSAAIAVAIAAIAAAAAVAAPAAVCSLEQQYLYRTIHSMETHLKGVLRSTCTTSRDTAAVVALVKLTCISTDTYISIEHINK
jgi:hypothetical protein